MFCCWCCRNGVKMAADNLFVTAGLSIRASTPAEPLLHKKHLLVNILSTIRLLSSPDFLEIHCDYYGFKVSFAYTHKFTQDGHGNGGK